VKITFSLEVENCFESSLVKIKVKKHQSPSQINNSPTFRLHFDLHMSYRLQQPTVAHLQAFQDRYAGQVDSFVSLAHGRITTDIQQSHLISTDHYLV
jgi:hypothetical protein